MEPKSRSYNHSTGQYELWGVDEYGKAQVVIEQPEKPPLLPPKNQLMNFGIGDECVCEQCTRK